MDLKFVVFFALVLLSYLAGARNVPKTVSDIIDVISKGFRASPHIVGGVKTVPHSHPHQVALYGKLENGADNFCGGSLISSEWVLTAEHCTYKVVSMAVVLGGHNLNNEEMEREMIRVRKFVGYGWNPKALFNDIALLKLAKPATLNKYVQPIRLPSLALRKKGLPPKISVVMTGWGRYSYVSDVPSPVLLSVENQLLSNLDCSNELHSKIPDTVLCVDGSQGGHVYQGDSGGPMIITESDGQKTIIGITSFNMKDGCKKKLPTMFTRVDRYLEWISANTGIKVRPE